MRPAAVKVEQFLVPLASQDLPVGRLLSKGDISLRQMDADAMKQEGMPLDLVMMAPEQIVGRVLRKQVRLGGPFLTTSLYLERDTPKYELKPGYRAVAVVVPFERGGYAEAGDAVDVYFTSTPKAADSRAGTPAIPMKTISVVDAASVLEVSRPQLTAMMAAVGYTAKEPTFLLQVLPDQVPRFQALQGNGAFSLMIRPKDDVSIAKTDGKGLSLLDVSGIDEEEERQQPPFWTTEIYRGRSPGAQHFPIAMPTPEQMAEMQRRYNEEQAAKAAAANGGPQSPVADVSPIETAPAAPPARRRPTLREPEVATGTGGLDTGPQVPYRASEPTSAQPQPLPLRTDANSTELQHQLDPPPIRPILLAMIQLAGKCCPSVAHTQQITAQPLRFCGLFASSTCILLTNLHPFS